MMWKRKLVMTVVSFMVVLVLCAYGAGCARDMSPTNNKEEPGYQNTNEEPREQNTNNEDGGSLSDVEIERFRYELLQVERHLKWLEETKTLVSTWQRDSHDNLAEDMYCSRPWVMLEQWYGEIYESIDQNISTINNTCFHMISDMEYICERINDFLLEEANKGNDESQYGPWWPQWPQWRTDIYGFQLLHSALKECIEDMNMSRMMVKWAESNIASLKERLAFAPAVTQDLLIIGISADESHKVHEVLYTWWKQSASQEDQLQNRKDFLLEQIRMNPLKDKHISAINEDDVCFAKMDIARQKRELAVLQRKQKEMQRSIVVLQDAKQSLTIWSGEYRLANAPGGWSNLVAWYQDRWNKLSQSDDEKVKQLSDIQSFLKKMAASLIEFLEETPDDEDEDFGVLDRLQNFIEDFKKLSELLKAVEYESDEIQYCRLALSLYPFMEGIFDKDTNKLTIDQAGKIVNSIQIWYGSLPAELKKIEQECQDIDKKITVVEEEITKLEKRIPDDRKIGKQEEY